MSISFNRNGAQVYYESLIGVNNPSELRSHSNDFKNHRLTQAEANRLTNVLKDDSSKFFFNGLECLLEGIRGTLLGNYSWSAVKLYYSIYYFIRASLAVNGYAIIRSDKTMYRLRACQNEQPLFPGGREYSSTHEGTIKHYKDVFLSADILLSNQIDGKDAYEWMKDVREIVNYRSEIFAEPNAFSIWDKYIDEVKDETFLNRLKVIYNDPLCVYCFQEDYAILAIPLIRLRESFDDITRQGGSFLTFTSEKKAYLALLRGELDFLPEILFS